MDLDEVGGMESEDGSVDRDGGSDGEHSSLGYANFRNANAS